MFQVALHAMKNVNGSSKHVIAVSYSLMRIIVYYKEDKTIMSGTDISESLESSSSV